MQPFNAGDGFHCADVTQKFDEVSGEVSAGYFSLVARARNRLFQHRVDHRMNDCRDARITLMHDLCHRRRDRFAGLKIPMANLERARRKLREQRRSHVRCEVACGV